MKKFFFVFSLGLFFYFFNKLNINMKTFQVKVEQLNGFFLENERLKLENYKMKSALNIMSYNYQMKMGKKLTQDYKVKLNIETGSPIGISLKSLEYRPPANLLASQLYELGLDYFNRRDHERTAVIFSILTTDFVEDERYSSPQNELIAGVAWYRLENKNVANYYFDRILKRSRDPAISSIQNQARIWKAILAKKSKQELKSQYWLNEALESAPHSEEVKWVNSTINAVD